jgi:hypothetical protein
MHFWYCLYVHVGLLKHITKIYLIHIRNVDFSVGSSHKIIKRKNGKQR